MSCIVSIINTRDVLAPVQSSSAGTYCSNLPDADIYLSCSLCRYEKSKRKAGRDFRCRARVESKTCVQYYQLTMRIPCSGYCVS